MKIFKHGDKVSCTYKGQEFIGTIFENKHGFGLNSRNFSIGLQDNFTHPDVTDLKLVEEIVQEVNQ